MGCNACWSECWKIINKKEWKWIIDGGCLACMQVAIATGEGIFIDPIRKAQLGIDLPNVQTVDPKSFAVIQADKLHLTPESQVQLGTLMGDAFIKLDAQQQPKSKSKKSAATSSAFHLALIIPLVTSLVLIILTTSSFRSWSISGMQALAFMCLNTLSMQIIVLDLYDVRIT